MSIGTYLGRYLWQLLLVATLAACSNPNIIPQRKLVRILADMHTIDAATVSDLAPDSLRTLAQSDTVALYQPILKQYGYTWQQLQNTLLWYTRSKTKSAELYANVVAELQDRELQIQKKVDELYSSQDQWDNATKPGESDWGQDTSRAAFELAVQGLGQYILTAKLQLEDTVRNPRITLALYAVRTDSVPTDSLLMQVETPVLQADSIREYTLRVTNADTMATVLRGYLLNYDPDSVPIARRVEIEQVMLRFVPQ